MKKLLGCLLSGAFIVSMSCSDPSNPSSLKGYKKIRQDSSFYNAVTRIENIQLVDIRSAELYNAGHIPGATNVEANYANSEDVNSPFCKEIQARFDKNRDIFLYGAKAQKAENWYAPGLVSTIGWDMKHTYHYLNDYEGWVDAGYPICSESSRVEGCPCQK
ncbi:MAG: rhodanese-like domain-containing protein [Paludibacteraceae bacterium]|nr:rhodanese-like domain-containing protein [Paludibacteraceae bacterium]